MFVVHIPSSPGCDLKEEIKDKDIVHTSMHRYRYNIIKRTHIYREYITKGNNWKNITK